MALQIYPRENAFKSGSTGDTLLDYLRSNSAALELDSAAAFCNFPLFREEDVLLAAQIVLISPAHGIVLISTAEQLPTSDGNAKATKIALDGTFSQVFSRLIKYPRLRRNRTTLLPNIDAFLWIPELNDDGADLEQDAVVGLAALGTRLDQNKLPALLDEEVFNELVSVIDGSKALIRPPERIVAPFGATSKVAQIQALEEEIRRFDRDQRVAYMTDVQGPQRIRGLAGSGKTVVLAMKAALIAVRNPEARIAFTFYTKSLYQHVKHLITRFYRLHEDRDPDWDRIKILHSWGGSFVDGFYSHACKLLGTVPITYGQASALAPNRPFEFVCERLLAQTNISPIFDYVFVDEAQDFPPEFMRLALKLANQERLVIAYDVLQTIFDVETPTAGSLFGLDEANEPAIAFDEDIVLHKCYRNPREILICAHAIGFGIYGPRILQMLESKEHWEDFGYKVVQGNFVSGEHVKIERSRENSPSSISDNNSPAEILQARSFASAGEEVLSIAAAIKEDISVGGVLPEDILVISADDRNARFYFRKLAEALGALNIPINNLQDDSYGIREFKSEGKVTTATVYKAKGNEAYIVYLIGIDYVFQKNSPRFRNMAFTAMTRAKGWLRVSGVGPAADACVAELNAAKAKLPFLEFVFPSPEQLLVMKRDLVQVDLEEADATLAKLAEDMSDEELELLLAKKLREVRARSATKKFGRPKR